jgi:hypothetical protein
MPVDAALAGVAIALHFGKKSKVRRSSVYIYHVRIALQFLPAVLKREHFL